MKCIGTLFFVIGYTQQAPEGMYTGSNSGAQILSLSMGVEQADMGVLWWVIVYIRAKILII
jgi:hypothetical protein